MARDFAQIEKAALAMKAARTKDETTSLPPGYISGFYVTLKQDYTVTISAGTAYVAGRAVKSETEHMIEKADWVVPRLDTPNHYYVYLAKTGAIYVDLVQPKFNPGYGYYEQPDYGWRAIGKLFLKGNDIIYAVRQVEKKGSTVTVAAAGFTGEADYYCPGDKDDILINAAIQYLHAAYDGGEVRILQGNFNCVCKPAPSGYGFCILPESNIDFLSNPHAVYNVQQGSTGENYFIYASGKSNIRVSGGILNTFSGSTGSSQGVTLHNITNSIIENVNISCPLKTGLSLSGTGYGKIQNNIIDSSEVSAGMTAIISSVSNGIVSGNIIHSLRSSGTLYGIQVGGDNIICSDNDIYDLSTSSLGIAIGILASSDNGNVISNRVRQVKNSTTATNAYGIRTSGISVKITANYCYNNGSDTGIANTNGNNFSDAGTDTQVYSNSWQSPVAGEPSLGTPHPHYYELVTNANPTASGYTVVDCSAQVPTGTTAVYVWFQCRAVGAGSYMFISKDNTSSESNAIARTQVAGATADATGIVRLNSSRQFYYWVSTADIDLVYIRMFFYWL